MLTGEDFKKVVKILNFFSVTKHEALQEQKENFKQIMPLFKGLDEKETETLIHRLKSMNRKLGDDFTDALLTAQINREVEKKLAKVSEDANFDEKNRYRLEKTKLNYADKRRMAVDQAKIKEMLRNRTDMKLKIDEEIENYGHLQNNPQFEYGILSYLNESTYGEMRDLVRDVGIHTDNIEVMNVGDYQKKREQLMTQSSDHNF